MTKRKTIQRKTRFEVFKRDKFTCQQLEDIQERRDQLDMMLEWKTGLMDLDGHAAKSVGEITIGKMIRQFGIDGVIEVKATNESLVNLWEFLPKILRTAICSAAGFETWKI